jgi:hypothetical protein
VLISNRRVLISNRRVLIYNRRVLISNRRVLISNRRVLISNRRVLISNKGDACNRCFFRQKYVLLHLTPLEVFRTITGRANFLTVVLISYLATMKQVLRLFQVATCEVSRR